MTASSAPASRNSAASATQLPAHGIAATDAASATSPKEATAAEPSRWMSSGAASPAINAPSGIAAIAVPSAALMSSSRSLISGSRGIRFA